MGFKTFPGGVHPPDSKKYSSTAAIEIVPLPGKVVIPLSQHIGAPSRPLVKVGDEVKTGQKIAEPGGFVSIPMHASISGKITKIDRFPHPTGIIDTAIEISGDGKDTWIELENREDFLSIPPEETFYRPGNLDAGGNPELYELFCYSLCLLFFFSSGSDLYVFKHFVPSFFNQPGVQWKSITSPMLKNFASLSAGCFI